MGGHVLFPSHRQGGRPMRRRILNSASQAQRIEASAPQNGRVELCAVASVQPAHRLVWVAKPDMDERHIRVGGQIGAGSNL